jgi:hypothetical protein
MARFHSVRPEFRCWTCPDRLVIVVGMAKADVLDRVAADLARGCTAPAIQRLSSLVAAHPTDLDLRRRLAVVHRMVGNRIEAGRWGYLLAETAPTETEAFERAYPAPAARLRKLRWPAQGQAATEFARARLAGLADAPGPATAPAHPATRRPTLRLVAFALATPFAVVGAVTVVQWLVG